MDAAALARAGFDLLHPFDTRAVAAEPGLERLAIAGGGRGVLIANTRALWAPFIAAVAADPSLAAETDPLDRYTERALADVGGTIYFAHRAYAGAYLPFQRLAVAAGLGVLSPTYLVVHPTFGPWLALRAVAIFDEPPTSPSPSPISISPCTCASPCRDAFTRASTAAATDWRAWLAVRDACPVGRAHRYSDDQLAYHYTKDHRFLRAPA